MSPKEREKAVASGMAVAGGKPLRQIVVKVWEPGAKRAKVLVLTAPPTRCYEQAYVDGVLAQVQEQFAKRFPEHALKLTAIGLGMWSLKSAGLKPKPVLIEVGK